MKEAISPSRTTLLEQMYTSDNKALRGFLELTLPNLGHLSLSYQPTHIFFFKRCIFISFYPFTHLRLHFQTFLALVHVVSFTPPVEEIPLAYNQVEGGC